MLKGLRRKINGFFLWGWRGTEIRPWDYHYLIQVMEYQLSDMEKSMSSADIIVDNDKYARQMRIVLVLLKRWLEDDYLAEDYQKLDEYVKTVRGHDIDTMFPFTEKTESDAGTLYTPIDSNEATYYRKEIRRLMTLEAKKKDRDLEDAFGIIIKRYKNWWW